MNAKQILLPLFIMAAVAGCQGRAELDDPTTPGDPAEPVEYIPPTGTTVDGQPDEIVYGPVTGDTTIDTRPDMASPTPTPTPDPTPTPSPTPTPTPAPTWTRDWFVSPTGSDSAAGAQATPFKTISRAMSAVSAGERIVVMPGVYREQLNINTTRAAGTAAKPILLQGVDKPKIVAPGTSALAVISRQYWILDGFDFDGEGKAIPGLVYQGDTAGSVLRNSLIHGGQRNGIVVHGGATNVTIENNQIYDWWHDVNDAHGIGVLWNTKNVVIRNNKIFQNSGDSVQCEGPEPYGITDPPGDNLLIENNELTNGKENAVDIKTCTNVTIRNNWAHDFTQLGGCAFVVHMSAKNVLIENNKVENVGRMLSLGGNRQGPMPAQVVIRKNKIRNVMTGNGMEGIAISVANADRPIIEHNTFADISVMAVRIGDGTNGPTDGLTLRNNILSGPRALQVGSQAPGLISKNNLIEATGRIQTAAGLLTLQQWQATGADTGSKTSAGPLCDATYAPISAAVNAGTATGAAFCGSAPDIGAVETGC